LKLSQAVSHGGYESFEVASMERQGREVDNDSSLHSGRTNITLEHHGERLVLRGMLDWLTTTLKLEFMTAELGWFLASLRPVA